MRGRWPVAAGAGALALHVGYAATWLPAVRRFTPALAGRGRPDHLALTFDDGPSGASTPLFLDALERAGVHATFFLVGTQLVRDQGLGRAIVETGHEVGVHGYEHRYLLGRPPQAVYRDLARARDLVQASTGVTPTLFRPPYGVLTGDGALIARRLGLRPVIWTAWAKDWTAAATPQSVYDTIAPGICGGGTLLLHDADRFCAPGCWRATLGALPRILDRAAAAGLTVGPLRDHG
jgi:peptidoglycan/xylan/chitin deacetylase (PgdA/CDA1 family)